MDLPNTEPMALGSPTSPKLTSGAQFLPGFLMGDLPAPTSPQPRSFTLSAPILDSSSLIKGSGGAAPPPVVPTPKEKSGAPPVRSIQDDLIIAGTPQTGPSFSMMQSPLAARFPSTPGAGCMSPGVQQFCLSPAQVDPFYSQGESLSADDQLDQTWVTVFGFPPASASYILLQFAQYGNILKHMMASPGNWMHLQYQSRLQARKALSKDGKVFADAIMVGVKPCIDKSVMDNGEAVSSPLSSAALPATPRSAIRPLSATYRTCSNDNQVVTDRQTPRKDDSFVSKAMEYMFSW